MRIRGAEPGDWPAMWRFMAPIVAAGETFSWDRDTTSERAREIWLHEPPGAALVAVGEDVAILGTATMEPDHGGPAAHVATASFMVDHAASGRGVGRALGEAVIERARAEGFRALQFNAVVEANTRAVALWRSLGFAIVGTVPEAFEHPSEGFVGLHVMHRYIW